MSPSEKLLNSTNSTQNAKEMPEDFSLLFELVFVVGVVLIGGIAMIIMVYTIESYRHKKRKRKILVNKELQSQPDSQRNPKTVSKPATRARYEMEKNLIIGLAVGGGLFVLMSFLICCCRNRVGGSRYGGGDGNYGPDGGDGGDGGS
ncbi:uncharacterized protein EAE98_002884 [Botrytis deweyae]|uniref:Transmembrane protein n=1 Tax=Botrytis deweyae TaxID=2478750 RepID=A0ABQ7IV12_9HELO|nr:uncharacterized protein EAE98_002884 [Botrytis deweyae]KAF7934839.1 hypothetical protein EAE98_002884 [Botrytis deweyae]